MKVIAIALVIVLVIQLSTALELYKKSTKDNWELMDSGNSTSFKMTIKNKKTAHFKLSIPKEQINHQLLLEIDSEDLAESLVVNFPKYGEKKGKTPFEYKACNGEDSFEFSVTCKNVLLPGDFIIKNSILDTRCIKPDATLAPELASSVIEHTTKAPKEEGEDKIDEEEDEEGTTKPQETKKPMAKGPNEKPKTPKNPKSDDTHLIDLTSYEDSMSGDSDSNSDDSSKGTTLIATPIFLLTLLFILLI
ncbi:hypothetical protein CYY_008593 [Polysphondylium violaceum]|uniref:Uncharacterized protein n=1 Tax=Polysphondylium violaceum TaxID=133409 RepID=A0A8J4PQ63_9MYCE|nr:hypothetical protein CYY_008593 [Polysphondylium violaceum]